jgi:hypothetical protein
MMGRLFLAVMVAALLLLAAALALAITKAHAPLNEPFRLRPATMNPSIEGILSQAPTSDTLRERAGAAPSALAKEGQMKLIADRPCADPEAAARKLVEIANSVEALQEGRIFIELINGPFLFELKGTPAEYSAGLKLAIERDWLRMHESGTYVKFTPAGAELFA